jgi:hypothetical protein
MQPSFLALTARERERERERASEREREVCSHIVQRNRASKMRVCRKTLTIRSWLTGLYGPEKSGLRRSGRGGGAVNFSLKAKLKTPGRANRPM